MNGRDRLLNLGDYIDGSVLTAQFGELSVFKVKISALYIALPYSNGVVKCSTEKTLENCQDDCQIETIQNYCNCTPVSWSKLASTATSEFCTLDKYMNCVRLFSISSQNYLNIENESSSCSSRCLPYCKSIRYEEQFHVGQIETNHAEIVIRILQFPYFVYSEDVVYTFLSFISELGGDLQLWLNLDFLIFMHILFFTLCIIVRLVLVLIRRVVIPDQEETPVEELVRNPVAIRAIPLLVEELETHRIF